MVSHPFFSDGGSFTIFFSVRFSNSFRFSPDLPLSNSPLGNYFILPAGHLTV